LKEFRFSRFHTILDCIVQEYVFYVFFSKSKKRDFMFFEVSTCQKSKKNV